MARFNQIAKSKSTKTINKAGGEAFAESPQLEFVSILLTSFVQNQYYRSANETIDRIAELIKSLPDCTFAAKAAIYARNEFGMRSVSHVVAAELARLVKGEGWMYRFIENVVHRPDDMTEIISYYGAKYGLKPLPNNLKKGIGRAFAKFDEYQLAKYQGKSKNISLVDVVNLTHPRPVEKNELALKKLVDGNLKVHNTWENKLTEAGKAGKTEAEKNDLKKAAWTELILERKIGYFALLRNLRNIIDQAPEIAEQAAKLLIDEKLIRRSLVLPFRFATAEHELLKLSPNHAQRTLLAAINEAIDISCKNVPVFDGETLVVLDTSGSMQGRPSEIGSLFSAILIKSNLADMMTFDDNARYVSFNPMDSVFTIAKKLRFRPAGTNFHAIFKTANKAYDRIIIMSDMQGWIGYHTPTAEFNLYKGKYNANPHVYSFNLHDYGSLMFPEPQVYALAGFSEKIFDIMKLLEQDKQALVNTINSVEL